MGVKLPTVNKFLFCFELELGGLVIGWIEAIFSAIFLILFGILLILSIITFSAPLVAIYLIYVIYFAILLYASVMLIKGTQNKNHAQMIPFLVLMAIGVVIAFLQIFTDLYLVFVAILYAVIMVYFFICIYSLYDKFKV